MSTADTVRAAFRYGETRGFEDAAEADSVREFGQTGTFRQMITAAVTLAVGVLVVGEIFDALPSVGPNESGPLNGGQEAVENTTGDAFELAPIVLIVIVAGLVLGVVRGF